MNLPRAKTTLAFVVVAGYIIITAGFFIIMYTPTVSLPEGDLGKQIIGMLGLVVGTWNAGVMLILTYHFGSSQSSADKNKLIEEVIKK